MPSGRLSAAGSMDEVTRILSAVEQGETGAPQQLLPLVYDELRRLAAARMASEAPGQTLDATALVHEAYLRLVDASSDRTFANRKHFFVAASEAMRRILVENARRKGRAKRGGHLHRVELEGDALKTPRATSDCSRWMKPSSVSPRSSRRRQSCSSSTRLEASALPRPRRFWASRRRQRTVGGRTRGRGSGRRYRKIRRRELAGFLRDDYD